MENLDQLNNQIMETRNLLLKRKKLQNTRIELDKQLKKRSEDLEHASKVLQDANNDVLKLEGFSMQSLLAIITSSKQEKLEIERAEAYAAKLKYNQIVDDIERIEYQRNSVSNELDSMQGVQDEFNELMLQKEKLLQENFLNSQVMKSDIENQINDLKQYLIEINEAKYVADEVYELVQQIKKSLSSASGYSTWDLVGGGLIASSLKHQKMTDAGENAKILHNKLNDLRFELADVATTSDNFTVDISNMLYFTDVFFDNIFTDLATASKISKAMQCIDETDIKVKDIISNLNVLDKDIQQRINNLHTII